MHTNEAFVPEPSSLEVKIDIERMKGYTRKSPGKVIGTGGDILLSGIHNLILPFGVRNNCHRSGKKLLLYLCVKRVITDCRNYTEMSLLPTTYAFLSTFLLSRLNPYVDKFTRIMSVDFDIIDQLLIRHRQIVEEEKMEYNRTVHQLFKDFEKAYDSDRKEVSCNMSIKFRIPMN
jgi:hypothetical protein